MNIVYVVLFVIIALFVLAYYTRRRFGVLGLALSAGSLLSTMWTAQVTPYIARSGFHPVSPPLSSVVAAALVLLPALFLLYGGPKYSKQPQRIIGAAAFALLAAAFLLAPLGNSLSLDDMGTFYYNILADNKEFIITAAIAYALFDILIMRLPSKKK
jgi:hypothetical protein